MKYYIHPPTNCTTSKSLKRTPCAFAFSKAVLDVWSSAAPKPYNDIAALVLFGTPGSVRGLNCWEYKWLPLSPKFNAKQHRWCENSYVCQVDQQMTELFLAFFSEAFEGLQKCIEVIWHLYERGWGECTIQCKMLSLPCTSSVRETRCFRKVCFLTLEYTQWRQHSSC